MKLINLINEMPHMIINSKKSKDIAVDLRIELYNIPKEDKKILVRELIYGDGVYAIYKNSFLKITLDKIYLVDRLPNNKKLILPKNWLKFVIIDK